MTINIRKLHLAIAVVAVALIAPATALATHVFVDVDDSRFYAEAVEWAKDNDITTGSPAGSDTFKPEDPVTRGENVTFAKRYDDNIVQPALTDLEGDIAANTTGVATNTTDVATNTNGIATNTSNIATNTTGVATNTAGIAALDTAMPFAVTTFNSILTDLDDTTKATVTVTVTAPVDGHVTVNSTATVFHPDDGGDVACQIVQSTGRPLPGSITTFVESNQWHESDGFSDEGSLSGTRTFAIAAGATVDYVLACEESSDGGVMAGRNLTAIFTPAP